MALSAASGFMGRAPLFDPCMACTVVVPDSIIWTAP